MVNTFLIFAEGVKIEPEINITSPAMSATLSVTVPAVLPPISLPPGLADSLSAYQNGSMENMSLSRSPPEHHQHLNGWSPSHRLSQSGLSQSGLNQSGLSQGSVSNLSYLSRSDFLKEVRALSNLLETFNNR